MSAERRQFPRIPGIGSLVEFQASDGSAGEAQLADISAGGLAMEYARPVVAAGDVINVSLLGADHTALELEAVVIRVDGEHTAVQFQNVDEATQARLDTTAADFAE